MSTKRIIRLDSSSLELLSCPRRFQFVNRMGLVPKMGSAPLDWGSALHKAIARWSISRARGMVVDEVAIIDEAVAWYNDRMCLKNEPRSGANLRRCLEDYFAEYAHEEFYPLTTRDGAVAVELPFAIPIYSTDTTDVLLTGKVDAIGLWGRDKRLVIKDIKHSSSFKPASHMEEQLGRPQFHIYIAACAHMGLIDDVTKSPMRVVVDCVYISKTAPGAKLMRSPATVIEPFMLENTMAYVRDSARRVAEWSDEEPWPHNYGECHGKYRKCDFFDVCTVPLRDQSIALSHMFNKREYDPRKFDE